MGSNPIPAINVSRETLKDVQVLCTIQNKNKKKGWYKIMYEIKETNKQLNAVEEYALTSSPASKMVKDIPDNTPIDVKVYAFFTRTEEKDGEEKVTDLLSILTEDNHVYCTQSETFKRSFKDCATASKGFDIIPIIKMSGTTNKGRDFVDCTLNIEKATELLTNTKTYKEDE